MVFLSKMRLIFKVSGWKTAEIKVYHFTSILLIKLSFG